ncbi:phage GP46 family protein [Providencia vermicola]|uniref:phage GP46 family protein n=1 Tax=Providencia vermicola TaxID=333965 RepID=UPI0032DB857F
MSDISTWWQVDENQADWLKGSGDVLSGDDLQSGIIISLFTDGLARSDDNIDESYRRGWWGDLGSDYNIGSRLWLLNRQKLTVSVAKQAEDYAREALKWLTDDGVVSYIEVGTQIVYPNRLNMIIRYHRPGDERDLRFFWVWEA